ncbi:hypothetical protein U1Q18_012733 [Sarracenia purpurea var. burkii]
MEKGDESRHKVQFAVVADNISPLSLSTLQKMQQKRRKMLRAGTICAIFDNSSPGYGWLLPGWIAEERTVESGRVYRVMSSYMTICVLPLIFIFLS